MKLCLWSDLPLSPKPAVRRFRALWRKTPAEQLAIDFPPSPRSARLCTDEELALRWQSGETDAKDELSRRYWNAARFEAKDADVPLASEEDKHAECLVALVKAAATFKPGRGATFQSYALILMRRAMTDLYRRTTTKSRRGDIDAVSFEESEETIAHEGTSDEFDPAEVLGRVKSLLDLVARGDVSARTENVRSAFTLYLGHLTATGFRPKPGERFSPSPGFLVLVASVATELSHGNRDHEARSNLGIGKPLMDAVIDVLREELSA